MKAFSKFVLAAGFVTIASAALAQQSHTGHTMPMVDTSNKSDKGPSSEEFRAANTQMHEAMDIPYSGDADVDFVQAMTPHHQGAIDMARIVLKYGKDPEIRRLADDIVKAQESEIAQMRSWLDKHKK